MISATQMRPGMVIKFNNELYSIFSVTHRTPGNLRGFVQAKMRNLRSGSMTEHRFSSEDKVEKAILDEQEMEYLYDDGEYYYFMNTETYEQMHLMKDLLGDATQYLIPQLKVSVEFYEGKPISVELPADRGHDGRGDRAGAQGRHGFQRDQAGQDGNGLVVQVPPFITEGEKIRVNTAGRHLPGTRLVSASARCQSLFFFRETPFANRAPAGRPRSGAITGGSPARSLPLEPDGISASIAISHVSSDCSGVEPPPITDLPGIELACDAGTARPAALRRARGSRCGALPDHGERGNPVPTFQQQIAERRFERLVDHLVEPQRAEQRIAAQACDEVRLARPACPACGPPSSLSPLKETRSAPALEAFGDERFVDAEGAEVDDAAAAEVFVDRDAAFARERRQFARVRAGR